MKNVFIIGSKGIPANYGGFETFVDQLVSRRKNDKLQYHVACLSDKYSEFMYNGAHCINIKTPEIGAAKALIYDTRSIKYCIKYIKDNNLENSIVYVLACRIGPFFHSYVKQLHKLNCIVFLNPDGHEWMRAKWNWIIKQYWKYSENLMIKYADNVICDSINIEKYIKERYASYSPNTKFISYGADTSTTSYKKNDNLVRDWFTNKNLVEGDYYLVVGRFVPENNYECIITEFMKSKTKKKLVLITDVKENSFYTSLKNKTSFDKDSRVRFVGTVYDTSLLKYIRENSFAYIHGHSVGGTNPSLLEALASTKINLLYNVGFNKEVAENGALYWNLDKDSLSRLIDEVEINEDHYLGLEKIAKKRIDDFYDWDFIVDSYEREFLL